MFRFSLWQRVFLGIGFGFIALSLSLKQVSAIWEAFVEDNTVYWNNLAVSPGKDERISKLDDATLVIRSTSRPRARLTLFTREINESSPIDLVKDLCGRDSCVYFPLEDADKNGAGADYKFDTPLRIVLMHPSERGIWLEYKGPPSAYAHFSELIDGIVTQIHEQPVPNDPT